MKHNCRALELDKILELLAAETTCSDAADLARALSPSPYLGEVTARLDDTEAAYRLMAQIGSPSFGRPEAIKNPVRRAEAGAALSIHELRAIAEVLRVMRSVKEWRSRTAETETCLDERFALLTPDRRLEESILTSFLSDEQVADSASPELAAIRRRIRSASQRVRDHLDGLIRSTAYQKALQEPIVTQRGGRFVVPVKAECRGEIPGLVHDTSATGATVFIEPMAVVEANNEIRVLESKEQTEIERIVAALSAAVGERADELSAGYDLLMELDLVFAKARLAYHMKATRPTVTEDGHVKLRHARHPLLDPQKAVPIDVELGGEFDTLVITGPNTGGKTVTLKTVGLLTLMVMCGLLPPVDDGSIVSLFDRVLADIGDEQSIEQSLSTFSAHMVNIIRILEETDDRTLVLIDELGSGTDPVEGAALAIAILEQLRAQGARIAATTHYAELKAYAIQTAGVENGSCEFDVSTLRPTYRLLVGVPGRSNAFAITDRLGMPSAIVDRARTLVSGDDRRLEDVVVRLEERRQALEQQLAEANALRESAQAASESAVRRADDAEQARERLLEDARDEARRIVSRARADAEALMDELDRLRKQKEAASFAAKLQENKTALRRQLEKMEAEADPVTRKQNTYVLPRPLKVGDEVVLVDIDKIGTVLALPDGNEQVEVQVGLIRTRVPLSNLKLAKSTTKPKPTGRQPAKGRKTGERSAVSNFETRANRRAETEVDLRGMYTDDGVLAMDHAIDNAVLGGIGEITVIHGKGTGALRAAVHARLRHHPNVKSFRLGTFGEGEMGVTIVEIKG
ncbi:MAG: endonuclease MutS2 [Clostridia bacterium]|nr:endonuclease MutS2 [Clostridia bacterium]